MFSALIYRKTRPREEGQALVEFALSLPILMLFIAGLIDFGMILFSYSQAANSLRNALRYAEVFGYYGQDTIPYLDCPAMIDEASNNFFTASHVVNITYVKATDTSTTYDCATVSNDVLENGDILNIQLTANVDPFFLPIGNLQLDFEGQRSIVKAIPVTVTGDLGGGGGGGSPPPAPTNFVAIENCTIDTNNVSFQWTSLSPAPDTMEIRDANTDVAVYIMNPADTAYCDGCDTISSVDGARCYYAVAFNEDGASGPSNVDCAACTADPLAPVNFTASANCNTGAISFDWDWGSTNPLPTRAIFYDADTGIEVAQYAEDPDVTQCDDCLTLTPPFDRRFYMIAVNGAPPNEKYSPASATASVECTAPPPAETGTATLTVELRKTQNKNTNCDLHSSQNLGAGQSVTIERDGLVVGSGTTGANGTITFYDVPTNADGMTFEIIVPGTPVSSYVVACDDEAPFNTIELANGDSKTISFGYH